MAKHEPIPVYGDGQNVRDWLYVEDHCAAIETVIAQGTPGETYCIGGDNEWKNLDLLHLLCDTVDKHLGRPEGTSRKLLTFVKDRAGHDRRYAIDATRIQAELGWSPTVSSQEGFATTIRWYLHPSGGGLGRD
jgi:dTDP-glucose 4,6-dehydratase